MEYYLTWGKLEFWCRLLKRERLFKWHRVVHLSPEHTSHLANLQFLWWVGDKRAFFSSTTLTILVTFIRCFSIEMLRIWVACCIVTFGNDAKPPLKWIFEQIWCITNPTPATAGYPTLAKYDPGWGVGCPPPPRKQALNEMQFNKMYDSVPLYNSVTLFFQVMNLAWI